jgi:hypothetical protein
VPFVEDYHMIEALSANRSDNTFHIRVLPGRARRCDDLVHAQALDPSLHLIAIDRIPVAQEITWSSIEWKRFDKWLRCPLGGGAFCSIEMNDVSTVIAEYDEHIE